MQNPTNVTDQKAPSPHLVPDHFVSFHEAELEEPVGGRPGEKLRQPGEAGCVAELLRRHVALAVAAAASVSHRAKHKLEHACKAAAGMCATL